MKKRASNIELLRIVAMFMIVASHFACHGVQHCNDTVNASGDLDSKVACDLSFLT